MQTNGSGDQKERSQTHVSQNGNMASRVVPEAEEEAPSDEARDEYTLNSEDALNPASDWDVPTGIINKLLAGRAILYPELPWGSPPSWKKSGQTTQTQLVFWESTTAVACLWVAASLPYALLMDGAKHADHQFLGGCAFGRWGVWPPTVSSAWSGVDLLCDFMFGIDLPVHFLTAKWVITTRGREEWKMISDLRTLANIYVLG